VWHETVEQANDKHEPQAFDSEHPLFILYTSGTTVKRSILHTTAATDPGLVHPLVRLRLKAETDVHWCAADIGWITALAHRLRSLSNGATQVMYEAPRNPAPRRSGRSSTIQGQHPVHAPTLIRTMMKWGDESRPSTTCRRCASSAASASDQPEPGCGTATVGHNNAPVVDTWWQTETADDDLAAARRDRTKPARR